MGAPRYKHLILEYLTKRPGLLVHNSEIQEACGITHDQVINGIGSLRRNSEVLNDTIHIINSGQTWSYHPNETNSTKVPTLTERVEPTLLRPPPIKNPFEAQQSSLPSTLTVHPSTVPVGPVRSINRIAVPVGKLFEAVGKTSSKETIVKDEGGHLFKIVPI